MSLVGALNSGKTALAVQQAALQVTGNNIANAGNADYTRQVAQTAPLKDQKLRQGMFVGVGVDLTGIKRQVDEALNARIRASIGDSEAADSTQQWLGRVEATFNELSDEDLSSRLSTFFNGWSNLANKPQDIGLRQVVLQDGEGVASYMNDLRTQVSNLTNDANDRLKALSVDADSLAGQIADMNQQIVNAEGGSGGANGLRDRRDALLKQLSGLMDITTTEDDSMVNVYVNSEPLVIGTTNRGVGTRQEKDAEGDLYTQLVFKANNGTINVKSGQIGSLVGVKKTLDDVTKQLDGLAGNLIFELNKIHSSGQGLQGASSISGENAVNDVTAALNDLDKTKLDFSAKTGSFVVHVKQKATGLVTSTLIKVDLDDLNGDDTTLNSLASSIDGVDGVSASINAGKLKINADSNAVEISFSQDTSGTLAALGVNNFFKGSDARDIAVNQTLKDQPSLLAASKNGNSGDNQTALAIAALESTRLASLNGTSLKDSYQAMINGVATASSTAKTNAEASQTVQETLEAQRESLSGVSLDEEAINLMRQQRAFQAASRLIAAVDEMMRTIINMAA